MTIIKSIPTS